MVSYTFFLEQKCKSKADSVFSGAAKLVKVGADKTSSEMKQFQKDAKKRQEKLGKQLKDDDTFDDLADKMESFMLLNDSTNERRTFNKNYKSDDFWLGEQYRSSLELGDYQTNVRADNRQIEERIKKQGVPFLTQMFKT